MLKTADESALAPTARVYQSRHKQAINLCHTCNDDFHDDTKNCQIFHSHSAVYVCADHGICWHDS